MPIKRQAEKRKPPTFYVFGVTRSGIEPRPPAPRADALTRLWAHGERVAEMPAQRSTLPTASVAKTVRFVDLVCGMTFGYFSLSEKGRFRTALAFPSARFHGALVRIALHEGRSPVKRGWGWGALRVLLLKPKSI